MIIAVKRQRDYFKNNISFNQKTTLCGKTIFQMMKKAKQADYILEMHYVGVESAEIAKERVEQRVIKGGHGIPSQDIDRRFCESLRNLKEAIMLCDLVALYDNTDAFRRFAIYKSGKLAALSENVPSWYKKWEEGAYDSEMQIGI